LLVADTGSQPAPAPALITTTLAALQQVAPWARDVYLEAIRQGQPLFDEAGITTPQRMAHFLAQAMQETGAFTVLRESMSYSAPRMLEIFGVDHHSAKITEAEAAGLAHNEQALAERVYGLGNPVEGRRAWQHEAGRRVSLPRQRCPADDGTWSPPPHR
jgi:putative chitinase